MSETRASSSGYASRRREYMGKSAPKPRKSGKRALIVVAATLAVLAIMAGVLLSKVFVVREILVMGVDENTANTIADTSGIRLGTSIYSVSEQKVRTELRKLGDISLLEFRVVTPDTIELTVTRRDVVAAVMHLGYMLLLDKQCYVVDSISGYTDKNVPLITGVSVQQSAVGCRLAVYDQSRLTTICGLLDELEKANAFDIVSEVNVADDNMLYLVSREGVKVILGGMDKLPEKLAWMKAALSALVAEGKTGGKLDVSSASFADYAAPVAPTATESPVNYPSVIDRENAEARIADAVTGNVG